MPNETNRNRFVSFPSSAVCVFQFPIAIFAHKFAIRSFIVLVTMSTQAPPSKKLRSCWPDLKVILKYKDENGREKKKVYHKYKLVLATLSDFVDTALTSGMTEEMTSTIVFQDTTPGVFELALKIEDPSFCVSRAMDPIDAMKVVRFYHKYSFSSGLTLCDYVLSQCISELVYEDKQKVHTTLYNPAGDEELCDPEWEEEDLEVVANAIALSEELDLVMSKRSAVRCLKYRLNPYNVSEYNPPFTLKQLKKLHPFMKASMPKDELPAYLRRLSKDELKSALLPRYVDDEMSRSRKLGWREHKHAMSIYDSDSD